MKPGMSGNDVILEYIAKYYNTPLDFESTIYLSQLMHARALKTGIESHRKNKPFCMGSLYWQMNDCWPTVSWASVDYYGRWKAAHYWVQEAFEPLLIVPKWDGDELVVSVISDDPSIKKMALKVLAFPLNRKGENAMLWQDTVNVNFNSAIVVTGLNRIRNHKDQGLIFEWSCPDSETISLRSIKSSILLPDRPKSLVWSDPEISIQTTSLDGKRWEVRLQSEKFALGVELKSMVDGRWSDNYFNLVPGKEKRIVFTTTESNGDPKIKVQSYFDYVKTP
jgi:beta-mannosidase